MPSFKRCRNRADGRSATALILAVILPHLDVELVRMLISAGADVNAVGR